jgi:myxalamid-type nonribosomal peptide synthetase MxaA
MADTRTNAMEREGAVDPQPLAYGTDGREAVRTRLREILGQALGIPPSEIDGAVPFMDLGATSLALVDAFRAIQKSFGVRPAVRRVFEEYDTVDRLADHLIRLMAEAPAVAGAVESAGEAASGPAVPLFPFQHHLWFLARYSEGAMLAHSHRVVWQLDGVLQTDSLERALERVRDRHEALRTTFEPGDENQRITESGGPVLQTHDFSAAGVDQRSAVAAWLADEARRPFDLRRPLWRAALLRLGPGRNLLVLTAHGLIADRSALQRMAGEVATIYTALESGAEPELDPPVGLARFGALLNEVAAAPGYGEARAYWTDRFRDGIPELNLPPVGSRPPIKQYHGARLVAPLPAEVGRSLHEWCVERRTTPYGTVLAAFQAWLHRLTGQRDVVLGVFGQGVPALSSTTPLVGNTTNPLPLRMPVDGAARFTDHADAVRDELLAAFDHQHYPFSALIRDLNPERDQSRTAIFSVALDWEPERPAPGFAGVTASRVNAPVAYVPYDLLVTVVEVDGGLQLQCDYSTELFDAGTVRHWMRSFITLLGSALAGGGPIHRLRLMTGEEERLVLDEWNRTDREYPSDRCFHELVDAQAARTPDAVAVVADDATLSYAELVRQADGLAGLLRSRGVGPGSLVGLGSSRSSRLLAGMLGILKAGGAYVPLDPEYPEERLRFMLSDTGAHLLLTETAHAATFAWHDGEVLDLDALPEPGEAPPSPTASPDPGPDDLAYLLYTSGSTGRPKGVPIPHRALVNLGTFLAEVMPITADDVVLATTSLSFDVAVTELLFPLAVGARIVLVPRRDAADAAALMARTREHGVTLMQATPSHWQGLLAGGWSGPPGLRVMSVGEALKPHHVERLAQGGVEVWNWYGPSETTIYSTGGRVDAGGPVTIGRPVANTQVYILDPHQQAVPVGMVGELFIGGDGLSPGYWRRPELTAERFMDNPIPGGRSPRLYRTGDLARYRPDGTIDFLGRIDDQVKIHGVRIEPGEIEAVLQGHEAVGQAAVVARDEDDGLKSLVAYLVPRPGAELSPTDLRAFLAERLPEYMVPAAFVVLRSLPLTPSGKLDSRGLPEPSGEDRMASSAAHVPPRTPVEESLCGIWRDLLKLDRVGVHDSFFDLGGHSLLLAPLMIRIRDVFQLRVGMRDVFDRPTVAELAAWIEEIRAGQATARESARPEQVGPAARARFDFLRSESRLDPAIRPGDAAPPTGRLEHLFVTGATGFVGAYILHFLMEETTATLHCLVRAGAPAAGLERIRRNVSGYGLWRDGYEDRVVAVPGDLARPRLALDDATWDRLAGSMDAILHSAALVNFVYPYQALKPINVDGAREIIAFACHARVKPIHYLSTTAVWPMGADGSFDEDSDLDHDRLLNLAYDETKWVAEKMLRQAAERGVPVAIYRPGEVSGDSRTGESDATHLASAFVKGSLQAGAFPALGRLDAAPVDYVARALVHLMTRPDSLGRVFHLCNPDAMNADAAYAWFRDRGYQFEVVPFDAWRRRILEDPGLEANALYPFAPLLEEFGDHSMQLPDWRTERTLRALEGSGIRCAPLDGELVATYVNHFLATGFLPTPEQLRGAAPAAAVGS